MSKKKNLYKEIELVVDSAAFEGVAVARSEGFVYFVKNGVPGDRVLAQILRKKKSYAETRLINVIEPSPNRIEPLCNYFGVCGGCSWQNMSYEHQIKWKKIHVIDSFTKIGKFENIVVNDVLEAPSQFYYRNKMEFSFGASRWLTDEEINNDTNIIDKNFALGLHIPGRFDKVLNVTSCKIQNDYANDILNEIYNYTYQFGFTTYHERLHTGFLRHLVIRYSLLNDSFLINLITTKSDEESSIKIQKMIDKLCYKYSKISGFLHSINDSFSPVAIGDINYSVGTEFLFEEIHGIKFKISPYSFFQTNSAQLNNFIDKIVETGKLNQSDIVWDLYCGTGSITLPASKNCKQIYGFELSESSIKNANENKELNNIENSSFYNCDLHNKNTYEFLKTFPMPDVIFIDPPRAGLHKDMIDLLINISAPKIVYVSCNPSTQARDCQLLSDTYNLKSIQPVDMFPQTYHIENIVLLEKK